MRLGFQEFRQLNDGIECTAVPTAHFTCNACLRHVVSNASAAIRCPVAHKGAGCNSAPFDDVTIARCPGIDQKTFNGLEARRAAASGSSGGSGEWSTEPEQLSNGIRKYTLTHAGVGVTDSLDAHHFGLAFTQYGALLQGSAQKVTKVEYYDNPALTQKFEATRQRFKQSGKDANPIWIFHGSAKENLPKIMEEGFKVGGKDYPSSQYWKGGKFPVAHGTRFGQGVYSATGPDTPMSYSGGRRDGRSEGSQAIILAMALKGEFSTSRGDGLDSWSNGSAGSDWMIFADDEQVLPVYVVHY